MIQLTAEIDIFSQDNGEIQSISLDEETGAFGTPIGANNVSAPFTEMLNKKTTSSANPFILGVSNLGDGSALFDEVDYFISDILFNENGELPESPNDYITLHIFGDIKSATIVFDTINGGYPTGIDVDGARVSDDDPTFTISDTTTINFWQDGVRDHTIDIWGWNKPNRPLVIQGIYVTPRTLEIGRRNIVSLERSIIDRSDIKLPSWGIISNGGSLEFNDAKGEIEDYAEQGVLRKGQKVNVYINNTLIPTLKQKIGELYTNEWNYDNNNRLVSVSLTDELELWQDKVVGTSRSKEGDTLYYILSVQFGISSFNIDAETIAHLQSVYVPYRYLDEEKTWAQIVDLCVAAQCYVYKGYDEKPIIKYLNGE